jgi:hypothetical protein
MPDILRISGTTKTSIEKKTDWIWFFRQYDITSVPAATTISAPICAKINNMIKARMESAGGNCSK